MKAIVPAPQGALLADVPMPPAAAASLHRADLAGRSAREPARALAYKAAIRHFGKIVLTVQDP